jgi:hypothetical protein
VEAFVRMFCANFTLCNGVNWSSPGTPETSTQSKKGVVLAYIAEFGRTLRSSTFGRVGTDETAIVKPIYPDLRRFLSANMIPRLEETGRLYADMFSSEINELYPSGPIIGRF